MARAKRVLSYDSNTELGEASAELAAASEAAGDTGAVGAYQDDRGIWQYVPSDERSRHEEKLGVTVVTVYVQAVRR